jgi:hypothetical protein
LPQWRSDDGIWDFEGAVTPQLDGLRLHPFVKHPDLAGRQKLPNCPVFFIG